MNALDASAVLLLYMTHADAHGPRQRILEAVRRVDGYQRASSIAERGAVDSWPVLTYVRGERVARVCIATVHLPTETD